MEISQHFVFNIYKPIFRNTASVTLAAEKLTQTSFVLHHVISKEDVSKFIFLQQKVICTLQGL
jgi:hypothetical protein